MKMKKSELIELISDVIENRKYKDLKEAVKKDIGFEASKFAFDLNKLINEAKLPYEMIQGIMFSKMFHYSKQYYNGDFDD